jgi:uncharacterized protein (UPF0332 family)
MSILNPEHLISQAARLVEPPPAGPPRQVDVRRAISAAYYAVFHAILIAAADTIIGRVHRGTPSYVLVYRSIDHKGVRTICDIAQRPPTQRYRPFVPDPGFGNDIHAFADATVALQEQRHTADYDPSGQFRTAHATRAIDLARTALRHWEAASETERNLFLTLLLFPPR